MITSTITVLILLFSICFLLQHFTGGGMYSIFQQIKDSFIILFILISLMSITISLAWLMRCLVIYSWTNWY
jgi:hypothetical protein